MQARSPNSTIASLGLNLGISPQRLDLSRPAIAIEPAGIEPRDRFQKLEQEQEFARKHLGQWGPLSYSNLESGGVRCDSSRKGVAHRSECWESGICQGNRWIQKTYLVLENASLASACHERIELNAPEATRTCWIQSIPIAREPGPLRVTYDEQFAPPATSMSELASPEGDLPLFRVIAGDYQADFKNGRYASRENDCFSYSLNPAVVESWEPYLEGGQPHTVIVATQNLHTDSLDYPRRLDDDPHGAPHLGNHLSEHTTLGEIAHLQEVKVPRQFENPVLVMPAQQFKAVAQEFHGRPYEMQHFLTRLHQSCGP